MTIQHSSDYSPRARAIMLAAILALMLAASAKILDAAARLPFFHDEMFDTTAAVRFVRELDYRSVFRNVAFDPQASTGIAATILATPVWAAGGSLYEQRLLMGAFWSATLLGLVWLALRRHGVSSWHAALGAVLSWCAILSLPAWNGFLQGLGELPGALYMLGGLLVARRHPAAAAGLWGTAVWLTKQIYLPTALAWIAALALSSERAPARAAMRLVAAFLAPLAAWASLIALRFGERGLLGSAAALSEHLTRGPGFTQGGFRFGERLDAIAAGSWAEGGVGSAAFFLVLVAAPFVTYALSRRKLRLASRAERLLVAATLVSLAAHAVWFFGFNPEMWPRHYQPAHYLGLGLAAFLALRAWGEAVARASTRRPAWLAAPVVAVFAVTAASTLRHRTHADDRSYARSCRDPFSAACLVPAEPAASLETRRAGFKQLRRAGLYSDERDLAVDLW